MAQIVTITNPLTGQPAQVDQLDHTAQQIDDAITRALPGGALDLEKAPSGFGGFGEVQTIVDINNDEAAFNAAIDNLLSRMTNRSAMQICFANYPVYGNDGTIFSGTLYKSSQDYAVLHGTNYSGGSIQKTKGAGTWRPWEWVNPPMVIDTEYRTTERWNGAPVYVQTKEISALAIGTSSSPARTNINNFTEACDKIVRYEMYVVPSSGGAKYSIPYIDSVTGVLKACGSLNEGQYLYGSIYTFDDLSKYKANVTCWYTKTTD